MALIETTHGPMDESLLLKGFDGEWVNDDREQTFVTEYCLANCPGEAHKTGRRDKPEHFCSLHVHRSGHVHLKKNVTAEGVAASFA